MDKAYSTRKKGKHYEELAAAYLTKQGYSILERNYQKRRGELDIIAKKDGVVVICEVKYRRTGYAGRALEAVDYRKQKKISQMAVYYLMSHGYRQQTQVRFDVIAFDGETEMTHIVNAFPCRYV